jgi:branched-chain amino acid transport system substrate-binding protein
VKPASSLAKAFFVVASIIAVSACSSPPIVGILLPATGSASAYGDSMKKGIDMALEEGQETLPTGFVVVWGDTASDPATGATELARVAAEGAKLIIAGTTSDTARALLPVLEDTDTVAVSPSASAPSLTKDSMRVFRFFASDELEGRRAGRFLYEDQDKTSVLIYAEDTAQSRGIEPPFRQVFEQAMGGNVVGRVVVTDPDWQQQSADLLAAHRPESVYIIAYGTTTIDVLSELREKGFDGTICASSAFYTEDVIDRHSELVEGVFFPQPAFDMKAEGRLVQSFVTGYRERYQQDPDIYAAHAYDAMRLAIEVSREVSVFAASEIRKTLAFGIKEFPGVTGIIQFNDYGDVHHNPIMFIVKDGEVLNYERYIKEEKEKIRQRIEDLLRG